MDLAYLSSAKLASNSSLIHRPMLSCYVKYRTRRRRRNTDASAVTPSTLDLLHRAAGCSARYSAKRGRGGTPGCAGHVGSGFYLPHPACYPSGGTGGHGITGYGKPGRRGRDGRSKAATAHYL